MPLTIQVASDWHFELHRDGGQEFIDSLDATDVDVLVLLGDICIARFAIQVRALFSYLADKYPRILYVPGNHELWGSRPEEAMAVLRTAIAPLPSVTLCNNQLVVVEGQRFLGGPMWFPRWSPVNDVVALQWADFQEIKGFDPWVVQENKKFITCMMRNLAKGDIVLTHYLPSYQSVPARYRGATSNAFFVCEMDHLILNRQPAYWLHGHTHDSLDYTLGATQILCNPFGYPFAPNPRYDVRRLITLP